MEEGEYGFQKGKKFTGKDLDEDTGLYYYNARWYDAEIGRFISEDPLPHELLFEPKQVNGSIMTFEEYINDNGLNWYLYCNNNPVVFKDPTGLATWVDKDGYVKNVTKDDDLNIYQWEGSGSYYLEEGPPSSDIYNNEKYSWMVIGETLFEDAFISPDTKESVGKVIAGESIEKYMYDLLEKADDYGATKIFYESRPKGEFDIKTQYPGHEGYSYHGFLFKDKYITLREAGNILAGMNAAQFEMDYEDFQKGAGALHKNGLLGVAMYKTFGKTYGNAPNYGEIDYQYNRSKYGYDLYISENKKKEEEVGK